jgi:hypothetical protein
VSSVIEAGQLSERVGLRDHNQVQQLQQNQTAADSTEPHQYNFSSLRCRSDMLLNLAAQLAPAYLRIGGTLADRLIFEPDAIYSPVRHKSNMSDGGTCSYEAKGCARHNIDFFNMTGMCRLGHFYTSSDEGYGIFSSSAMCH